MFLARCPSLYGGFQFEAEPPDVLVCRNVIVRNHALYDRHRAVIPTSALMREYGRLELLNVAITSTHNPCRAERTLEGPFLWLGEFHRHFGHFLISTVSRLWAWSEHPYRIAYTGDPSPDEIFSIPFARDLFSAFGLSPDHFVQLRNFDLVKNMIVSAPSFVENSIIHAAYANMMTSAGERMIPAFSRTVDRRPVYFSKSRLKTGISRITNENEVTDVLERAGVVIVYPEALSFKSQVAIWHRHDTFVGYAGSALHLAAFVRNRTIISLTHDKYAESNQALIGRAGDHTSIFVYPHNGVEPLSPGHGFHRLTRLLDPKGVANDLLRIIERSRREPSALAANPRPINDSVSRFLFMDEPFGRNVARGKRARTSSSDPLWAKQGGNLDAEQALSGTLSSTYQFHTLNEPYPWWEVDLAATHLVHEVRVFNRHDVALERASRVQVLFSINGKDWKLVGERSEPGVFDGTDSEPYRWKASTPLLARYVRLQLPSHDMLHLNQVEVFGIPTAEALI